MLKPNWFKRLTKLHNGSYIFKNLLIVFFLNNGIVNAQTLPLADNLINFNSPKGEKLLIESSAKEDYFPLSIQFVTQINQAYCGIASSVMVLNSLGIIAPEAGEYGNFRYLTQENFFKNPKTEEVIQAKIVAKQGLTLEELGKILEAYPTKTKVYHGDELTLEEFRKIVVDNLKDSHNFVLVNYLRSSINQEKGGHISPIVAYNEKTDRFLILDVSRYKYPPVWVKAEELWQAINTVDSVSQKTRGIVLVSPLTN